MKTQNNKLWAGIILGVVAVVAVAIFLVIASNEDNGGVSQQAPQQVSTVAEADNSDSITVPTTPTGASATNTKTTEELTLYLIEEEKLAHDVYTIMYQKYGAQVFGNILESESTHQARVLTLLETRNIADPRSAEIGVFKNQELQTLYNTLIEQGNISATEAYKVGVIIEEKDIADISAQLATTTDQDVVDTLESLRQGSENHLRAFNRKL